MSVSNRFKTAEMSLWNSLLSNVIGSFDSIQMIFDRNFEEKKIEYNQLIENVCVCVCVCVCLSV